MIESQSLLTSFWYRACFLMCICPKDFLSEIPEKASESFLFKVFLPKLFGPKAFDFNVPRVKLSKLVHSVGDFQDLEIRESS